MVYKLFDKKSKSSGIKSTSNQQLLRQINNLEMNFINELLENLKAEKCILHLKAIFGVLI